MNAKDDFLDIDVNTKKDKKTAFKDYDIVDLKRNKKHNQREEFDDYLGDLDEEEVEVLKQFRKNRW